MLAPLSRWIDLQTGIARARFKYLETSTGTVTNDQLQHSEQIRGRVKVDAAGTYAVNFGLSTGDTFVRSWNNTSIGTPNGYTSNLFVKQLFGSAAPVNGLEIQAGGLGIVRGESSEITSYDYDGYIEGERVTIKRPRTFHVDELSVTVGYLGDSKTASLWPRLHRIGELNYYQVLAARHFGRRFASSADVTTVAGATTVRNAFAVNTPELLKLHGPSSVRFEQYARFNDPAYGFLMSAERTVAGRFALSGGLADIDKNYGGLNSDRFDVGRRWFTTDTISLGHELALQFFYQHSVNNAYALRNSQTFETVLIYNLLNDLRRSRVL
ncbi:MAG TPA: hypothetical protein VFP91_04250 [Vicinamibacterales bacterium]|nr:hypothetical protein [Vicinamibacterales bacterium]